MSAPANDTGETLVAALCAHLAQPQRRADVLGWLENTHRLTTVEAYRVIDAAIGAQLVGLTHDTRGIPSYVLRRGT